MKSTCEFKQRPGITLVEVLLFVALVGIMATTILPLLFSSTESRQRQDAIALVEQNGTQVIQTLIQKIRTTERIIEPPSGGTGYILSLQTNSGATNPTIIALYSGAIVMVEGRTRRVLTSELVGVTNFSVDNTSSSEDEQSVAIVLGLRRIIRLHQPMEFSSDFDVVINLNPDDTDAEDECDCLEPFCDIATNTYTWQVCINSVCVPQADFICVYDD